MANRLGYDKSLKVFLDEAGRKQDLVNKVNKAARAAILEHPNVTIVVKRQVLTATKLTLAITEKSLHIELVSPLGEKAEFVFKNE